MSADRETSQSATDSAAKTAVAAPEAGRYRFIDSIRGFAALLVLYQHSASSLLLHSRPWEKSFVHVCDDYLQVGRIAVAAFFMVSGYVVPFSLKGRRGEGLERFAISRFFRLYPFYWFSLAMALAVTAWQHLPLPPWRLIALNATMLQQFAGRTNIIGVYWTLQIELIFYALCALMFGLGLLHRRRSLIIACAGSIGLSLALAIARYLTLRQLPVAIPLALGLMFMGTLWKRYQIDNDRASGRAVAVLVTLFAVLLPVISLLAYSRNALYGVRWFYYTNGYGLALVVFFAMTTFARVNARWAAGLGTVSYGVYLLHQPMLAIYQATLGPRLAAWPAGFQVLLFACLTVALCALLHRLLEQPAINAGKILSRHLRLKRLASETRLPPVKLPAT